MDGKEWLKMSKQQRLKQVDSLITEIFEPKAAPPKPMLRSPLPTKRVDRRGTLQQLLGQAQTRRPIRTRGGGVNQPVRTQRQGMR